MNEEHYMCDEDIHLKYVLSVETGSVAYNHGMSHNETNPIHI